MRLRLIEPDGKASERVVTAAVIRFGRLPSCEVAFDPTTYPMMSGEHARLERTPSGLVLTHLSRSNQTLLNDKPIEGSVPVKVGDRFRLTYSGPIVEILGHASSSHKAAAPAPVVEEYGPTAQAGPQHLALLRGSVASERFEIGAGGTLGRERGKVEYLLDHPHVSRRHATFKLTNHRVELVDLGSANGTYVNGRRLERPVYLNPGDRIDIGPFSLQFDGTALVSRSRSNNVELVARRVRRIVKDRATGQALTLLHDVTLVVQPREFVCLLGPSGSGKSTLLAMLSGRNAPNHGAVEVNGEDLYASFAALKRDIAVVPQKDVLHDSLSVSTALHYTAELRLPSDTSRYEIKSSVGDILEIVGLTKRGGTLIRDLSGGQVKRASLANELMSRPSLLFIDEVTSGLDEQTDREMMELFRQVVENGKTVVCITHNMANVEATCHLVVLLTEGGRLAFIGTPEEAKQYFHVARLGDVYLKLKERPAAEWQATFKASPFYKPYVRDRLAVDDEADEEVEKAGKSNGAAGVSPFRQAWILIRRYISIWMGDRQALMAMAGQSFLVALLLGTVFGRLEDIKNPLERTQRTMNLLFLLNVSCFWFGCNNSAKEIVKDRVIYERERDFNLRFDSYYFSRFLVLILIGLLQASLLFGIVHLWCRPPGSLWWQWLALATLAVSGTALGLLISAFAKTEEVAAALVPIAVIPQIILAGVIAPLSGVGKWLGKSVITVHWSQQALESLLPDKDLAALQIERDNYAGGLAVVAAHVVVFTVATLATLWWQGQRKHR